MILTAKDEIPKNSAIPPHTPAITLSCDDFLNLLPLILLPPLYYFLSRQSVILKVRSDKIAHIKIFSQNHSVNLRKAIRGDLSSS